MVFSYFQGYPLIAGHFFTEIVIALPYLAEYVD